MAADYLNDKTRVSIALSDIKHQRGYAAALQALETQAFWRGDAMVRGLWDHQRTAIAFCAAYLNCDRNLDDGAIEAALIKMPTGTGKSGVIATVSRCIPDVRRTLVLTPRTALTSQLKDDIAFRFWGNLGYTVDPPHVWPQEAVDGIVAPASVEILLPNIVRLRALNGRADDERLVVVGTFQALDQVRMTRDRLEQKLRRTGDLSDAEDDMLAQASQLMTWLRGFDLVIIDEGHYEPAPSWSRSVRELDRPTILLSATPFRNDYKLFRVRGRFVFNLPFQVASDARIVRAVSLVPLADPAATIARPTTASAPDDDSGESTLLTPEDRSAAARFVAALKIALPPLFASASTDSPKAIIRAGSFEILELLQGDLAAAFSELPVLIHERIEKPAADADTRRYQAVQKARESHPDARLWLHQTKLLEGIDEPTFVAVAIFDPFSNARQLVQQIGRVIRSTDPARKRQETATVLIPETAFAQTQVEWKRYLEFETFAAKGLDTIVPSEAYLPQVIVRQMPDMQYVDGSFRRRLPDSVAVSAADLVLPKRAAVFELKPGFDLDTAATEIHESTLASNRFVAKPIDGLPGNARGWTYFSVDESPYLANHFITEWRLGVLVLVHIGDHAFVFDSEGANFSPSRADLSRSPPSRLTRLLPRASTITRVSANALDMSDRAIRSLAQRTRSFAETFSDLLDPMLNPTAVSGFVGGTGRYLGLARGKLADATDDYVPVSEYIAWLSDIERELTDDTVEPNAVFRRYAARVTPDPAKAMKPTNILLDLTEEAMQEFGLHGDQDAGGAPSGVLAYEDLCAEITDGKFKIVGLDGEEVECAIQFMPERQRYQITSKALNARHPPMTISRARRVVSLTEQINRAQSFRVLTGEESVVYMYGEFLKARDVLGAGGAVLPLECATAIPALADTDTEKGELLFAKPAQWRKKSVFGVIKQHCEQAGPGGADLLEQALRDFHLVLLDDDLQELGDFLAIGERRVAIIHAKANDALSAGAVTKLETVGRQATASLAFCATFAQVEGIADDRWMRPTIFNKVAVNLSRVFRNEKTLADNEIAAHVRSALINPSYNREVWIVAGRLLDVDGTRANAVAKTLSNRQRQLLMFLESLNTVCGRANARLRVFGH